MPEFLGGIVLKRVVTSLVVLPLLIILIVYGSNRLFLVVLLTINLFALREFLGLTSITDDRRFNAVSIILGSLVLFGTYIWGISGLSGFFLFSLFILFLYSLYGLKDLTTLLPRLGFGVLGVAYISFLLSYFILLREFDHGVKSVLFLLTVVWCNDTSAYYIGKNFGKNKLLPTVSPNKTIEGSIGGIIGGFLASIIFKIFFFDTLSFVDALILPVILVVTGQLGDLFESLLKRWAGVKDAGSLVPGHGGVLDRIDSLLFTAPLLYFYSLWRF